MRWGCIALRSYSDNVDVHVYAPCACLIEFRKYGAMNLPWCMKSWPYRPSGVRATGGRIVESKCWSRWSPACESCHKSCYVAMLWQATHPSFFLQILRSGLSSEALWGKRSKKDREAWGSKLPILKITAEMPACWLEMEGNGLLIAVEKLFLVIGDTCCFDWCCDWCCLLCQVNLLEHEEWSTSSSGVVIWLSWWTFPVEACRAETTVDVQWCPDKSW